MSILCGPYDSPSEKPNKARDEELLVFGYACKLYRNDAKAILENSGQLLIPWMGDRSLMVDRYDVRNKLDDKSQFGLKPNLPRPMSNEEMDFEDELDKERYLALEWDEIRVEEQEEMEKRKRESAYSAVGFTYDGASGRPLEEDLDGVPIDSAPLSRDVLPYDYNLTKRLEHPSTAIVDHGAEDDQFIPHHEFFIPSGVQIPSTNKLHSIIEKTARFVCRQGNQMEIIIKTKQKFNPYFSFLNHEDGLYPYYRYLKEVISSGRYIPPINSIGNEMNGEKTKVEDGGMDQEKPQEKPQQQQQKPEPKPVNGVVERDSDSKTKRQRLKSGSMNDSDSDESGSDDEGYLHPLLLGGGGANKSKSSSPAPPLAPESSSKAAVSSGDSDTIKPATESKKMSLDEIMNLQNTSASFMARSLAINSAPSTALATEGEATQACATVPSTDPEAIAAYEYYRQQYYNNSNMAAPAAVPVDGQQEGWYGFNAPVEDFTAVYDGDPQQNVPSNGHYPPQSSHNHFHSTYAPPPPPSEHQYPPPYYHCPPEAVPPPEICAIVDKTAEYVAKNSEKFERTVLERHLSDPRFSFLNPWDQYNYYYEAMKQYNRSMMEIAPDEASPPPLLPPTSPAAKGAEAQALQKINVQKLSASGAVSFKLQPLKGSSSASRLTPASGFKEESYFEEDDEDDDEDVVDGSGSGSEGEGEGEYVHPSGDEQDPPPPKKQKVVNDDDDEIGNTVQAFLSTVKGLFNQTNS